MINFQTPRGVRRESVTELGRFRGGILRPVMAVPVRPSEGGMVSQSITLELDPIAGRLITPITAELVAVFVPVQAIDEIKDPAAAYAGMTEVVREKLLTGNPLFVSEAEGDLSKAMAIMPRSVGGVKKVNEAIRLAHNVAVNHLRRLRYIKAVQLLHSNTAITPAILSSTILQRMNGVLDPDDRINGIVQLDIPNMILPVGGISAWGTPGTAENPAAGTAMRGVTAAEDYTSTTANTTATRNSGVALKMTGSGATSRPDVNALLNGATAGNVSLTDFYNAEYMDRLTRTMEQIATENPEHGQEMILRWAHGLSVDMGKVPVVISQQTRQFGRNIVGATDTTGIQNETIRSDMALQMGFSVPIPKTELGGIIVTFCTVKPDETIATQPHPIASDVWGLDNFVADEMALDPVPVTFRDLDANVAVGSEATVAFYTGKNSLKSLYVRYGLNRLLNPTTVANKSAVWQLDVPLSVTPSTVLYPETLSHYPFADQLAEVVTYVIASNVTLPTPMIVGPSPVETLEVINTNDIFEVIP